MLLHVTGCCWVSLVLMGVLGGCRKLLDVVGGCPMSLYAAIVGCCWLSLDVATCGRMLGVAGLFVAALGWMLLGGCCWVLLHVAGCCWMMQVLLDVVGCSYLDVAACHCHWMLPDVHHGASLSDWPSMPNVLSALANRVEMLWPTPSHNLDYAVIELS